MNTFWRQYFCLLINIYKYNHQVIEKAFVINYKFKKKTEELLSRMILQFFFLHNLLTYQVSFFYYWRHPVHQVPFFPSCSNKRNLSYAISSHKNGARLRNSSLHNKSSANTCPP